MKDFFLETAKAWAAAAVAFGGIWENAIEDGMIETIEVGNMVVVAVVAWIVTWAIPNKTKD